MSSSPEAAAFFAREKLLHFCRSIHYFQEFTAMRRILYICLLLSACTSNNNANNTSQQNIGVNKPSKPEILISDFVGKNPKWFINDVVEEENCKKIENELKPMLNDGSFFEGMPFKLDGIVAYGEGENKGYVGNFLFDKSQFADSTLSGKMSMQVFGMVSENLKDELVQNAVYYLKAKMVKYENGFLIFHTGSNIDKIFLPRVRVKVESVTFVK